MRGEDPQHSHKGVVGENGHICAWECIYNGTRGVAHRCCRLAGSECCSRLTGSRRIRCIVCKATTSVRRSRRGCCCRRRLTCCTCCSWRCSFCCRRGGVSLVSGVVVRGVCFSFLAAVLLLHACPLPSPQCRLGITGLKVPVSFDVDLFLLPSQTMFGHFSPVKSQGKLEMFSKPQLRSTHHQSLFNSHYYRLVPSSPQCIIHPWHHSPRAHTHLPPASWHRTKIMMSNTMIPAEKRASP